MTAVDDPRAQTTTPPAPGSGSGGWAAFRRYASRPLFLTAVFVGLYLWVQTKELDSIEQRVLNADFLWSKLTEHLYVSTLSTALVIAIAVPLGILVTRPYAKRLTPIVMAIGNAGQAIPSLGLITIIYLWWGFGITGVIFGLVAYSALPILRNTMVGVQQVDQTLIESARGMGMTTGAVLRQIEMPLAVPVVLAGIRTALIINIGTASLVFLFGAGGLGEVIFRGFQLNRTPVMVTGALMVAGLALLFDYVAGLAEQFLSPRGL